MEPPHEVEHHALAALSSRRCLPLLAALLHLPALHATMLEETGSLPMGQSAAQVQVSTAFVSPLQVAAEPHLW